ncbi:right-handed parallel beta-helix repeat-containing protein [Paenibacillus hodogayensis]
MRNDRDHSNGSVINGESESPLTVPNSAKGEGREALPDPGRGVSRRKLVASFGMAGLALIAGGVLSSAESGGSVAAQVYGEGEGEGCCDHGCPAVTLAELRALPVPAYPALYFVKDNGQEGIFYYDPLDMSAADNTGLVVVSAGGARFKRLTEEQGVDIRWFGAKGDGLTDDTTAIQLAVNTVSAAGGGTVYVPASGTFRFTSIHVKARVALIGYGGVLKLKDNHCVSSSTAYYLLHNMNPAGGSFSDVKIEGIVLDGNRSGGNTSFSVADGMTIGGENAVIRNCTIRNAPDSGIMFSGATNSVCVGNRIETGGDVGIYVNDGNGTKHYENVISDNRITGFPFGGIALKRICQRTLVAHNTIYDCGNGITLEHASTSSDYSRNVSIIGNRLRNIGYGSPTAAQVGINLRCSDYTIVADNRIEWSKRRAILIEASQYCSVSGNVIEMKPDGDATHNHGIQLIPRDGNGCHFNTIRGNVIVSPVRHGIYLSSASTTSQNNSICGNIVRSAGGIALRLEAGCSNNVLSDNVLEGTYDMEYYSGALNNSFANNRLVSGNVSGSPDQTNGVAYAQMNGKRHSIGTTAPTAGTWKQGDLVYHAAPASGGYIGWVCVTAGSPGVWSPFGPIA